MVSVVRLPTWLSEHLATDSPGVEKEPAGEGDDEQDDGEVELELLVLIFISKPAGKHSEGSRCAENKPSLQATISGQGPSPGATKSNRVNLSDPAAVPAWTVSYWVSVRRPTAL